MTLPNAGKLVADALRELAEAERAKSAFYELHGYGLDPDKSPDLRAVLDRCYAADRRVLELAHALYPPKPAPAKSRRGAKHRMGPIGPGEG